MSARTRKLKGAGAHDIVAWVAAAAAGVSLFSCGGAAPAPAAVRGRVLPSAPLSGEPAACRLRGDARFADGEQLYLDAARTKPIGRFLGVVVGVDVDTLAASGSPGAHVAVHAPPKGPGMTLRGWVAATYLPLAAAREIAIAGPHVVIERGAPLQVAATSRTAMRVEPRFSDLGGVSADVDCEAFMLGRGPEPTEADAPWHGRTPMHLLGSTLTVYATPGGAPIADLRARQTQPTVYAEGRAEGMTHIRSQHGLRVDAWVRDADLVSGFGPDCDDCDGMGVLDVADRCPSREDPDAVGDLDGCPEADRAPLIAPERTDVLAGADAAAPVIGELDAGADVYVFEVRGGMSRIGPGTGDLREPTGGGLWVRSAAIRPR